MYSRARKTPGFGTFLASEKAGTVVYYEVVENIEALVRGALT